MLYRCNINAFRSGTVGICVCTGTLDSPPLGDLTSCLEGSTCKMSAADTQTYISGLLAFEGCTVTSSSVNINSDSTSTSGGVLGTGGLPISGPSFPGQPSASAPAKPNGVITYSAHSGVGFAFGVTVASAFLSKMLV
jgi:hypothetical protein